MSNGNSTQSVSLADGSLSPDLRVNYTFGLVLGVNEFQQEQEYLLQKAYLYNRAFQGYGTVSGLLVTADWQKGEEVLISVSPGMAIDQFGMPIVVRDAQCARLTAWLKKQEAQQAGTIKNHRKHRRWEKGEKRDLRVYIIARYDEYADGKVPIAGQACSTSDTQPIYSRMHDSYTIDYSWDPPSLPAWESVRCFSQLMAHVRIKEDAERNDTDEIIEQVLKLADPGSIPFCASRTEPSKRDGEDEREDEDEGREKHHHGDDEDDDKQEPRWYIPTSSARESLDRIFRTWVMEVRPKLLPDLLDPSLAGTNAQPDILLAHIDFTLDDDWEDTDPRIEEHGFDPPDNGGRPFLLPTQVMQELLLIGQKESLKIDDDDRGQQVREFATIQVRNNHTLYTWIHHPRRLEIEGDNVDWGEALEVRSDGQPLTITNVTELEPNVLEIRVNVEAEEGNILLRPGTRVELVFKVDEINVERVDDDDDGDDRDEDEDEGEKRKSGDLEDKVEEGLKEATEEVAHRTEDVIEEIAGGVEKEAGEVIEDIGKDAKKAGRALMRAIGVGKDIEKVGARVERAGERGEDKGQELITTALADEKRLDQEEQEGDEENKGEGEEEDEHKRELSLGRSIRKLGLDYVGYDRDEKTIIVYTIASHNPVRELVTFFVYDQESDMPNMPHTELKRVTSAERFLALWFHTDDPVRLPPHVRIVRTFVNQQPQELVFRTIPPDKQVFSWFWALEPQTGDDEAKLVPGELLTVIFNTNDISIGGEDAAESLTDVMKDESFSCVGYDGNHTIEVHHQVSPGGSQGVGGEPDTGKLPVGQPPAAPNNPPAPALPFVTVIHTGSNRSEEGPVEAHLELWFHLSANPYDNRTGFTDNLTFEALFEDGREMRIVRAEATRPRRGQHNVYTSTITLPPLEREQGFYYLRLRFSLDTNEVSARSERIEYPTLRDYIRATGIRFEGYNGADSILAYVRVFVPPPNTGRTSRTAR